MPVRFFHHVPRECFSNMRQFIMLFVQQCVDFLKNEFRLPLPVQKISHSQVQSPGQESWTSRVGMPT